MRDLLSFADVAVVGGCAARRWCIAEVEAKSTRACQTIEKHSLAANGVTQRPWSADRYLLSDLADGDFHSTASLSCTTGSLARKEGRSLFYGSGKQRILPRRGAFWACQMTVTVTWTATVLRGSLPASPSSWPLRGLCLLVPRVIVGWSVSCYLSWHSVILHGLYNHLSNASVAGNMARRHRGPGEFLGLIRLRQSRLDDLDGLP